MLKRLTLTLGGVAAAAIVWAGLVERTRFQLREHTVACLPKGSRPVRVLHLSDLHMAPWQRGKQDWIASLALLRPDLVVGTGDFLGHDRGILGVERALTPFAGVPGVFVNGSNDYFAPHFKNPLKYFAGPSRTPANPKRLNIGELYELYDRLGWHDLNNRAVAMPLNGVNFGFVGVDDAHKNYDQLPEAQAALSALGRTDVTIGVTHAPYRRILDAVTSDGASMVFAGHTHGGQVCLPEWAGGTLVTNCDIPRDQARGLSEWVVDSQRAALHVSAGIGTSITAPVRTFCPPEAALITLIPSE
ncbi:MAG: metallophosphoesterase [Microbacteriaceae bacterium]